MRILVYIKNTTFHKEYGGLETQNKMLCEGLAKRGHEITVVSPKKDFEIDLTSLNGVNYIFLPCVVSKFSSFSLTKQNGWLSKSLNFAYEFDKKNKIDLFISQSSAGLEVIKNKKDFSFRILSISHGTKMGEARTSFSSAKKPLTFFRALLNIPHILRAFFITQRQFIHGSDLVIAVSQYVKNALVQETYVNEKKIRVIHNGVSEKSFDSKIKGNSSEKINILYVGRMLPEKGIFDLLTAYSKLEQQNVFLTYVGEGQSLNELKLMVSNLGLENKVQILGHKEHGEVLKYMANSDIFVLPSKRVEGFPMVLVEAMFSKLAIITTDMGGNSDAIDNDSGILLDSGSAHVLIEALNKLIKNEQLRTSLAEAAYIKAHSNFTLDVMLNKYEKVFEELLNESFKNNL